MDKYESIAKEILLAQSEEELANIMTKVDAADDDALAEHANEFCLVRCLELREEMRHD